MTKGFKVVCIDCNCETTLISVYDGQCGFNSEDIRTSNKDIEFYNSDKVIISCKCGNKILDY